MCLFVRYRNQFPVCPIYKLSSKHIFGILMVLRKYEDHFRRRRRPKMYLLFFFTAAEAVPDGAPKVPNFLILLLAKTSPTVAVSQIGTEGTPNVAPKAAVSRVDRYIYRRDINFTCPIWNRWDFLLCFRATLFFFRIQKYFLSIRLWDKVYPIQVKVPPMGGNGRLLR